MQTKGIIKLEKGDDGAKFVEGLQVPAANGYTNVKGAFSNAKELFDASKLSDEQVFIVLLTDGKPKSKTHTRNIQTKHFNLSPAPKSNYNSHDICHHEPHFQSACLKHSNGKMITDNVT